jgi:hypothetical protein
MPLPEPKKNEEKQEFVSRCIETLTKEDKERFPSRGQRAAVCYSQWDEYQKKHGHPEKAEK